MTNIRYVVVVVVGEGIMRHYDPPPDPNFLPCDFTDWAAQHQGTKAPRHPPRGHQGIGLAQTPYIGAT